MANTRITQGVIKPNEDYDVRHINATGIITAQNISIGGTLTYNDVTNVDSIGIITARKGILIGAGQSIGPVSGIITYYGDGSKLSGIDATQLKGPAGNVVIQGYDTGAVHTGFSTMQNLRVTGIATFGTSSTVIDGDQNVINVGTALTLGHTQGLQFHTQNLHSAGFEINQINASGIITASEFRGSGAGLSGMPVAIGTALGAAGSNLDAFFYVNKVLPVTSTITVDPPSSSDRAYTHYTDIQVSDSADLIIAEGDDLIPDVLGLANNGTFGGGSSAGRLRVNLITDKNATGAPTVSNGLIISGVTTTSDIKVGAGATLNVYGGATFSGIVTASSFSGDGSNLTGIQVGGGTSLSFNDNVGVYFGNSNDLQIYHQGNSDIKNTTGYLRILSDNFAVMNEAGNQHIIRGENHDATGEQSVRLYYAGNQKFETLSDGVNITGTLKVNGSAFSSSSDRIEEGNSFAEVLDTGTNGVFRFLAENNEVFRITTDGKIGLGQTANSFPTSRFEIRENAVGFTTSLLITNLNPTNQNNLNIVFAGANNVPTASIGGWAHADATSTANEKGDLFFRTKNAGAFKEHMRVNHQGKIIYSCNHDQSTYFNDNYSGNNSRNVFNSVTHHKRYVGYNNPTWYEYKTTSGTSARPQLVYFTCYWSTGHASGFGYYNFHVIGRNPHNSSTLTIERARRGDYGSWGGQYYGWSSSPDITVYTSTKSGSDAGFFIRSQGHISANSGTWDGQCVQQWKIEAYDNQYAGMDNAIFTFAGHSTPSGVGGSVGWG